MSTRFFFGDQARDVIGGGDQVDQRCPTSLDTIVETKEPPPQPDSGLAQINVGSDKQSSPGLTFSQQARPITPEPPTRKTSNDSQYFSEVETEYPPIPAGHIGCNSCRASRPDMQQLEEHKLATHVSYACPVCQTGFSTATGLSLHATHSLLGADVVDCGACLRSFDDRAALEQHVSESHPEAGPDPGRYAIRRRADEERVNFIQATVQLIRNSPDFRPLNLPRLPAVVAQAHASAASSTSDRVDFMKMDANWTQFGR